MSSTIPARGRRTQRVRIFELMDKGCDNAQIAERLGVRAGTVANWRITWCRIKGATCLTLLTTQHSPSPGAT